jgi:hypothetical protein
MNALRAACVLISLPAIAGLALAEPPPSVRPGPEHERLGYFVGTWRMEGEVKENPFSPAGTFKGTENCKWFEGGFALVCRSEGEGPAGPTKSLAIMGYSTEEKVYTYYVVENSPMTMTSAARGTFQDGTFVYDDESSHGGRTIRSRYTIRQISPTSFSIKAEVMGANGSWTTMVEGTSTKKDKEQGREKK